MAVFIRCPECQTRLEVSRDSMGRQARCDGCNRHFVIQPHLVAGDSPESSLMETIPVFDEPETDNPYQAPRQAIELQPPVSPITINIVLGLGMLSFCLSMFIPFFWLIRWIALALGVLAVSVGESYRFRLPKQVAEQGLLRTGVYWGIAGLIVVSLWFLAYIVFFWRW